MKLSAIILCGGTSRRMGRDKASLPLAGETMLGRVVRLVSEIVPAERIVSVAAAGQTLPNLPPAVRIVRDREPDCGPLEGLAAGLAAVADAAEAAFVTTCDAPLLSPAVVTFLAERLEQYDAVVPRVDGQWYPLTAVYRTQLHRAADDRLKSGERRVIDFVESLRVREVSGEELREVDAGLESLRNCNSMGEYRALRGTAKFEEERI